MSPSPHCSMIRWRTNGPRWKTLGEDSENQSQESWMDARTLISILNRHGNRVRPNILRIFDVPRPMFCSCHWLTSCTTPNPHSLTCRNVETSSGLVSTRDGTTICGTINRSSKSTAQTFVHVTGCCQSLKIPSRRLVHFNLEKS